jgi:hypothetical protein
VRYSRALHDAICANIREGNRPVVAAQMAGLPEHTFHSWMQRGKEGDPHLWEFARDVELSVGRAEGEFVEVIKKASKDDPDVAKWWLERGRSGGWSKQVNQLVNAQLEETMLKLEAGLTPEDFQKVLNVLVGQSAKGQPPMQLAPISIVPTDDDDD